MKNILSLSLSLTMQVIMWVTSALIIGCMQCVFTLIMRKVVNKRIDSMVETIVTYKQGSKGYYIRTTEDSPFVNNPFGE